MFLIIVTYYPYSKKNHNLKVIKFEFLRKSKYVSKSQIFKSSLAHVNGM
jgi:hypothetical protein